MKDKILVQHNLPIKATETNDTVHKFKEFINNISSFAFIALIFAMLVIVAIKLIQCFKYRAAILIWRQSCFINDLYYITL